MRDTTTTPLDDGELIEIRGLFPRESIGILDAVAQATPGESRVGLLRKLVAEWCDGEVRKATQVFMVARGSKPRAVSSTDKPTAAVDADPPTSDDWRSEFLGELQRQNKSIRTWSNEQGFDPSTVYRVLRGAMSCRFGQGRVVLIAMGGTPPSRYYGISEQKGADAAPVEAATLPT